MAIPSEAGEEMRPAPLPAAGAKGDRGPGAKAGGRLAALDVARGVAVAAMAVYHFAWDLRDYHLVSWDVAAGPLWRLFARSIASSFLIIVGISLVLASRNGFKPLLFLRRLAIIVGAAALVSFGTWWFAGDAFAFFGILHLIAVGSVLAVPFLFLPSWVGAVAAVAVLAAPYLLADPVFDAPAWWWLGLVTIPPRSVDYVPVLPWFAPILVGIVAGRFLLRYLKSPLAQWTPHGFVPRAAAWAGRWSLPIYLIHQPLLVGLVTLAASVLPVSPTIEARIFESDCMTSCASAGRDPPFCRSYCSCLKDGAAGSDLMTIGRNAMTADQSVRWSAIVGQCREDDTLSPEEPTPSN
jgi:uncharacterized membrane protein